MALADQFMLLLVEAIAQHSWSLQQHEVADPHCYPVVFAEDTQEADAALEKVRSRTAALIQAYELADNGCVDLKKPLLDTECFSHQLSLELKCICDIHGWTHDNEDLRTTIWRLSAGAHNTKWSLEDLFKELTWDQQLAQGRGGRWQRYQQAVEATLKRVDGHGTQMVKVTREDFNVPLQLPRCKQLMSDGLFVPPAMLTKKEIAKGAAENKDVGIAYDGLASPCVPWSPLLENGKTRQNPCCRYMAIVEPRGSVSHSCCHTSDFSSKCSSRRSR